MDQLELYRFFVPYKDNANNDIAPTRRDEFVKEIKLKCCEVNGGFTFYEGYGGWLGKGGDIIEEPVTILETYGKNPLPDIYWEHYATFLKQECLLGISGVDFSTVFFKSGVDLSIYKNAGVLTMKDGEIVSYRDKEETKEHTE